MSDEALRALEKKPMDALARVESIKRHLSSVGAHDDYIEHCDAISAAILSARQEVAPVVALANALHEMGCENVETWTDAKMIEEALRIVRGASQFQTSEQEVAPVADEYGWVAGPPHRILSKEEGEWFIAETIHGDRVVLKGLPEEYTYDFTTADGTYWKREFIKRWRQFPDSEYKPLGDSSPAQTSEARDAVAEEVARAVRKFPTWPTDPLHALAVLGEEFGELTKAVLQSVYEPHKVKPGEVRTEAVQTAAMALRFLQSLDAYVYEGCEQHSQDAAMRQEAGDV